MKNLDMEKEIMHRGEVMLDAFGNIKDEYVIEASAEELAYHDAESKFTVIKGSADEATLASVKSKNKKRVWMKVMSAAAVLVLCVGVGSMALNSIQRKNAALKEEYAGEIDVAPADSASDGVPSDSYGLEAASEEAEEINSAFEPSESAEKETTDYPIDEPQVIDEIPYEPSQGEALVLTAAQWNDNENWPFFVNLVNSGKIDFPSYGIDPRNRIKVTLLNEDGSDTIKNETVYLKDEAGNIIWQTKSNKNGIAYMFYGSGRTPFSVEAGETTFNLDETAFTLPEMPVDDEDQQGTSVVIPTVDDIVMNVSVAGETTSGVQVMFIVDTTGSMGDELAYLQMDFVKIAEDTAGEGMMYSANFYRDSTDAYVTKTNSFTSDVNEVQRLIADEYAFGGGDTPEAVADILYETITTNKEWRDDMNKVCFLIFDAPPHYGTEQRIVEAVESAAARGIHIVPVVASNAERETELFGRALAICTDGEYVFLTDDSGIGNPHLEPIVGDYNVELLHDIIVRIINSYK